MSWRGRALEALPRLESWVRRSPVGRSGLYARAFHEVYFGYKRWVEDDLQRILQLEPDLARAGHVLDVGGGLGYTARLFAARLDPGFAVHVFEPAPENAAAVRHTIARYHLANRVRLFETAVSDRTGTARLALNAVHRADHRLAAEGELEVPVTRLDDHLAAEGIADGPVSLVKVDVQGGEPEVLTGLGGLRCPVLLEFHPPSLRAAGHDPAGFLGALRRGGRLWWYGSGRRLEASPEVLDRALARRGYADLLWRRT